MSGEADGQRPGHVLTGGCQCGAVRYGLKAWPGEASICHCRMCQKAFGSYFAPLASVERADLEWTRGAPAVFRSSTIVTRGFCAACGTPLTYDYEAGPTIAFSLGSLDDPTAVPPAIQYGIEGVMPFFSALHLIPSVRTDESMPEGSLDRLHAFQHPDHDTHHWPPADH